MRANYKLQRLYTDEKLDPAKEIFLSDQKAHYLIHVLRMKEGDQFLLFNGIEGEWRVEITTIKKKQVAVRLLGLERPQPSKSDLIYCFAPLKHARLDYMVQKAVEMGASILQPVMTSHTQVSRLNMDRMEANIIEAAEQCGILTIPKCEPILSLDKLLLQWQPERHLLFCDEAANTNNPVDILLHMKAAPLAVLIGPEGGFSQEERQQLQAHSFVTAIPLGPRILRADTAAVAALAVINATLGDWVSHSDT